MSLATDAILAALGVATVGGAALTASPQGGRPPTDVNVVNTPTVNIGNTPTVNVGNFPNAPTTEPAHIHMELESQAILALMPVDDQFVVPSGKRLTIQYASAQVVTSPPHRASFVQIDVSPPTGASRRHYITMSQPVTTFFPKNVATSNGEMLLVANAGDRIGLVFGQTNFTNGDPPSSLRVDMSGTWEDVP